jgi:REP element-mobilizing transposase RayT
MSMPYNLPQRKTPRATWHDYNGANYFITICTKNHDLYFGDVVDGRMELSEIGEWAHQCAEKIEIINDNVFVPEFVVMPNHVHLIVIMDNMPELLDDQRLPRFDSPTNPDDDDNPEDWVVGLPYHDSRMDNVPEINEEMQRRANCCGRLSHIIGQFKSAVTKYAHEKEIPFAWQPRFHDHIIRNGTEMNRIADYIQNNPMKWELDRFYKKR